MKLHSKIIGTGNPLLILHGFLGMGDNWKTLGNQFAKAGYEVHLIDQRNHGKSPHSEKFSYEIMAEDIAEYCRGRQLKKVILLGHSMGGKTAMFFAVAHPEIVEKLIVADIAPKYYAPHHQQILEGLSFLNSRELTSRKEADQLLSRYVEEAGVRQFLLKNLYWKEKGKLALRLNLPALSASSEKVGQALPAGKTFDKPTLFIKGDRSDYLQASDRANIQEHFPQAQIETVFHAGHWVHAENREGFYKKVVGFIKP